MIKVKRGLSTRNLILIWVLGLAGQLCWNMENQWFNMYVYKFFGYDMGTDIITGMVIFSALATAFSTFLFGTLSDRLGKRKPFVCFGYIIWGVFTFLFGLTHLLKDFFVPWLMITTVVLADSIMSFFGSMGNDSGFNAWETDLLTDDNKNAIGISIAVQPVVGTIVGTVVGGIIVNSVVGYVGFFAIMGVLVSLIGVIGIFTMKEADNVCKKVDGKFFHQFGQAFNFKRFFKIKELVLVFLTMSVFFIGFNCFFNYIGNIFVYNYGFNEGNFGYLEGIALMVGIIFMIIFTSRFKKDRSPLIILVATLSSIVGLVFLTIVTANEFYDVENLLSVNNIPLFICVVIVGFGYVCFMQTIMTWGKQLYPEDQRGQFEGIKVISFVLIPMVFGSLISKVLISLFGKVKDYVDSSSGVLITGQKVPNEALFIAAIIIMALSLIPLFFVSKMHKQRLEERKEIEQ